jgi:hypothetical protein
MLVNWQPRHQQDEEAAGEDASTGSADTEPNTLHVSRPDVCGSSSRSMESGMPDYGFGRCDGHHKMIDFRLEKRQRNGRVVDFHLRGVRRQRSITWRVQRGNSVTHSVADATRNWRFDSGRPAHWGGARIAFGV